MDRKLILVLVKVLGTRCLYAYPSCSYCRKKVRANDQHNGSLWCSSCNISYDEEMVDYRYHVNLNVFDGQSFANVTIFGECWNAFFGLNATEFCRYVTKCETKASIKGVDMNQAVHSAMERCLVGEMVKLAFQ
ncbi:DNA damage-induced apoptosis suppressor protein-like isoform X2 [Xenia sp. Carnegie-2017]|nr:DNA damage-induced apoptosis suppressor protein-like isoform X2 [Xenia sp. Carnegie-2017]